MRGAPGATGWPAFGVWSIVGALFGLSVVGAASIGLFVLPVGFVAAALAWVSVRAWPEITGVLLGLAGPLLLVGLANLGSTPCPSSGAGSVGPGVPATPSCGGLEPTPWLAAGLALASAGLVAYSLGRSRS